MNIVRKAAPDVSTDKVKYLVFGKRQLCPYVFKRDFVTLEQVDACERRGGSPFERFPVQQSCYE